MDEPPGIFQVDITSMEITPFYIFSFVAIAILLFLSAMISASEVAFFSLKSGDLDKCRESEDQKKLSWKAMIVAWFATVAGAGLILALVNGAFKILFEKKP